MDSNSVNTGIPEDKILEGKLFDLLEERAGLRLGDLARLRRQSRQRGILLLDAAYQEGRLSPELAEDLAIEAGIEWYPPGPITSSVDGGDSESSMFEDTMDSIIDGPPIEMNVGHELRIRPSRLVEPRSGSQAHPSSLIGVEALEGGMDRIETSDRSDTIRRQVHACAERMASQLQTHSGSAAARLQSLAANLGEALRLHGRLIATGRAHREDQDRVSHLIGQVLHQAEQADNRPLAACLSALLEPAESPDITGEAGPIHAVLDVHVQGSPCTVEILISDWNLASSN